MKIRVELVGAKDTDDDCVLGVSHEESDYYRVRIGVPDDMEWCADFSGYGDALNWAEEVADCQEVELVDGTFSEEDLDVKH